MAAPASRPAPGWIHPTDLGGAVALAAFCIVVGRKQPLTFPGARPADLAQAVIIAVACLGLALRRPMPSVSVLIGSAGVAVYLGCSYTGGPVLLVPLVGMFFAGYHLTRARVWQLAGTFAVFLAVAVVTTDAPAAQAWVWLLAWPPMAAALGLAGAARRRHELDLAERDEEEDRRQHAEARRQLAEARLQTARELHDVIGHSLASITILAGAGSRRVETDPAAAKEVLDEIRAVSATALSDVRQALDALNDPAQAFLGDDGADLAHLIERLRRVGLVVDDRIEVDPGSLDPAVATALHRIAQESLTNVMRHSGSLHASIAVQRSHGGVLMTVSDDGNGAVDLQEGRGIQGMRRRAEELGGRLSIVGSGTGETGRSGLSVVVWVPVRVAVEP